MPERGIFSTESHNNFENRDTVGTPIHLGVEGCVMRKRSMAKLEHPGGSASSVVPVEFAP
jgi:hypothetical protein